MRRHAVSVYAYGPSVPGPAAFGATLAEGFAEQLGRQLAELGGPDGYWLLRRVDVRAVVSRVWSPHDVAGAVARATALSVTSVVRAGTGSGDVLWWPDRAGFLASFLIDAADGRSDGRWEYAQLADASRPPGQALLRLAEREPAAVRQALLSMDARALHRVVAAQDAAAAARSLEVLAWFDRAQLPRRDLVLRAWRELSDGGSLPLAGRAGLLIALTASRRDAAPLSAVAPAARELGELLDALRSAGRSAPRLLDAVVSGRWGAALELTEGNPDAVLAFVRWPAEDRAGLVPLLAETSADTGAGGGLHTAFGGMFLLLPLLDEVGDWRAATAGWPPLDDVPAYRLGQLLVLTAALGGGTSAAPASDAVLRMALGIPVQLTGEDVLSWWEQVPAEATAEFESQSSSWPAANADPCLRLAPSLRAGPAELVDRAADALVRALAHRLPGLALASAGYLRRNVLDLDASVTLQPGRAVAELGAPPLQVLLSLAGVNRGSFRLEGVELTWTLTSRD